MAVAVVAEIDAEHVNLSQVVADGHLQWTWRYYARTGAAGSEKGLDVRTHSAFVAGLGNKHEEAARCSALKVKVVTQNC